MSRPPESPGTFCHICAMPMRKPTDFGTDASGLRQHDFCSGCYSHGQFTAPKASMQDMLDLSLAMMAQENVMEAPRGGR